MYTEKLQIHTDIAPVLPGYDRALGTRRQCIVGCIISWAIGLACFGAGCYFAYLEPSDPVYRIGDLSNAAQVLVALALNILVTLCTDCLGFAHTTSLRWHLWREQRLAYNSNLRLLTGSKTCRVNSWYANLLLATSLIFCYTASSQILLLETRLGFGSRPAENFVAVNGIALFVLGIGLMIQAAVATFCLSAHTKIILSWSSNPLNNTLACLHHGLERRNGRAMLSTDCVAEPAAPVQPQTRQPSARKVNVAVRRIEAYAWVLFVLALVWPVILIAVAAHMSDSARPSLREATVDFGLGDGTLGVQHFYALLLVAALQALVTLGTHIVELLVNKTRDERLWRQASRSAKGAPIRYDSAMAAATTWQSVLLFVFKPALHWFFGLGLWQQNNGMLWVDMTYFPLFLLAAVAFLLATFTSFLARSRPKGPQPAAWGHLQTLADLIDDWGGEDAKVLYWGDKGLEQEGFSTRHAGTSEHRERVGEIVPDCLYS